MRFHSLSEKVVKSRFQSVKCILYRLNFRVGLMGGSNELYYRNKDSKIYKAQIRISCLFSLHCPGIKGTDRQCIVVEVRFKTYETFFTVYIFFLKSANVIFKSS